MHVSRNSIQCMKNHPNKFVLIRHVNSYGTVHTKQIESIQFAARHDESIGVGEKWRLIFFFFLFLLCSEPEFAVFFFTVCPPRKAVFTFVWF